MLNEEQALYFTIGLFILTLLMLAWNSRWHLLQGAIFMAVVASDIHWDWTDHNPHLAVLIGGGLAFGATYLATAIVFYAQRWRHLRTREHPVDQHPPRVLLQRPRRQRTAR